MNNPLFELYLDTKTIQLLNTEESSVNYYWFYLMADANTLFIKDAMLIEKQDELNWLKIIYNKYLSKLFIPICLNKLQIYKIHK